MNNDSIWSFEKYLVDEKIFSWMLCDLELNPWPLLKFILIVEEVLDAVFGIFWTSLSLAQLKFLHRRWFLGFIKTDYGTSQRYFKFVRQSRAPP